MKKIILLCAFLGITIFGYSQEVKVNINNEDATVKDECPYRINGICSTEDIGGVDVELAKDESSSYYGKIILTNYNSFPVSVLWKISYYPGSQNEHKIGNTVLGIEGQKEIFLVGSSYFRYWTVSGLIVRKLAQNDEK